MISKRQNNFATAIAFIIFLSAIPFFILWAFGPFLNWWVVFVNNVPVSGIVQFTIVLSPFWIIYVAVIVWNSMKSTSGVVDHFEAQITKIDEAKGNLRDSISYLDELRNSLEAKTHEHEQLSSLVNKLTSASEEKAQDLKAKLDAIAYVNRRTEAIKLFISFVLGVVASLVATAIWTGIPN